MSKSDPLRIWKTPYQRFGYINVNVLCGIIEEGDKELFFGPLHPNDIFIEIEPTLTLPQLMSHIGIFESTKEAERQGFKGKIVEGFSDYTRIKKMHRVTILKITQ